VTLEALQRVSDVDTIVDHLFELHSAVITPRVIARRQVIRLVERVIAKAMAESPNKENAIGLKNSEPENKRMISNVLTSAPAKPEIAPGHSEDHRDSDWPTKMLLDEEPESERSAPKNVEKGTANPDEDSD
jgi:hypothetical protein